MDKQKLAEFRSKLEKERNYTLDTLHKIEDNEFNDSLQEYTKEISLYDNHPADIGTETSEMEKTYALEGNELHRLEEIDAALERLDKGTYGKCTICGAEIGLDRLEAYPEADTCMNCSRNERLSSRRVREGRPVEEEVVSYPYNSESSLEENSTGFDGEDSWQSVERFNRREDDPSNQTADQQGLWDEETPGTQLRVEEISNEYYKKQLPDEE
ncbi:MAG: DnaK suppressor protein [Firmicutes bacterium]|nr:DnaK suppressor protein [Bacillota bacterium]MDI6705460.1 TraR/DksA C4-type zinc finger protein [Bacillota bacterium]